MSARAPLTIQKDRLLIVEGNDEERFFSNLLTFIHPDSRPIQIIPTHGKSKLNNILNLLSKQPNFNTVVKFGIVVDADDDVNGTFASVGRSITDVGLPAPGAAETFAEAPPTVGVFIMPGAGMLGSLESLCLEAVSGERQMPCVDQFATCITSLAPDFNVNVLKLRMKAYVATIDGARLVGEAANQGRLNFANPRYNALKAFLARMLA